MPSPRHRPGAARALPWLALLASASGLAAGCATVPAPEAVLLPAGLAGPAPAIRAEHATPVDGERVRLTREYFEIHHPAFAAGLPPGHGAAAISFVPQAVVIHFTAIPTLAGTLEAFQGARLEAERPELRAAGELNVGIQFVVDRDGTIYRLLPETVIGRHAIGLNHVAIGIENVGDGDLGARRAVAPLTRAQLAANVALVRWLVGEHPTIRILVGHHELPAVERPDHPAHTLFHEEVPGYRTVKVDPGRRFMARLRSELRRAAR